jgi:hypothetical protein
MCRNVRSKVQGVAHRPITMGSCSRRVSHPRDSGMERVLLSLSLYPSDPDSYPINAA